VIRLNTPPLSSEAIHNPQVKGGTSSSGELIQSENDTIAVVELPEPSVLFVDDDLVLRKLFSRSVTKAAPWKIQEANGKRH
jgi:hypothetical protein